MQEAEQKYNEMKELNYLFELIEAHQKHKSTSGEDSSPIHADVDVKGSANFETDPSLGGKTRKRKSNKIKKRKSNKIKKRKSNKRKKMTLKIKNKKRKTIKNKRKY